MKEKSMKKKRKHLEDGEEESPVPKKQIKVTVGEMGGLTEMKKKKKEKDLSGEPSDAHHKKDKKEKGNVKDACGKKKKEDRKLDLNDIDKGDHTESDHRNIKKKKKKKKSKNKDVCDIENAVVGLEDDRVYKKKKRGKGTSGGVSCEDVSTSVGKSKKKAHDTSDAENDDMETSGAVGKKEKKKKRNKVKQSDTSVPSDTEVIVPKKKKKKKIKDIDIDDVKKCDDAVSVGKKKKKAKVKHRVSDEVVSSEGVKMSEKSRQKDTDAGVVVVDDDNDSDEVVSTDKVKKGKKRKKKDADDIVGDDTNDIPVSKKKKKGKKDKSPDTETSVLGAKKKKDKKKREINEGEDDKNGHDTCGSPVSKKKTVEKVVDSENLVVENENGGQPDGGTCNSRPGINMGQWGTATFDNKERQDKFYRLLGGFKKTDSLVQNTAVTNSAKKPNPYVNPNSPFLRKNLALSSSDAKNLDDNLEKDFNRAMEWKLTMPRGTGIGYTPPPDANKLFYIDKTKSTSIKFD